MQQKVRRAGRFIRRHLGALIVWGITAGFLLGGALILWAATLQIPDLASLEERQIEQSVKFYDRTGTVLLYDLHKEEQRTIVPLEEISPLLQQAVIAVEDAYFYQHSGIRPTSIVRAILTNLLSANPLGGQGGSTITQQVVKGSLLVNDKTIARKLKEWILAIKLEQVLTKEQILELYLNQVPFGGSLYGAEEAAQTFFGKSAHDVTASEAAYLAAVLPAPSRLSPYRLGDSGKNDQLEIRHTLVLDKMHEHGYLTEEELDTAKGGLVEFVPPRSTRSILQTATSSRWSARATTSTPKSRAPTMSPPRFPADSLARPSSRLPTHRLLPRGTRLTQCSLTCARNFQRRVTPATSAATFLATRR